MTIRSTQSLSPTRASWPIAVFFLALAALAATPPRAALAADAKTKLHELPDRSFSIELPESWAATKYDNPRVALQFKPDVERKEGQITDVFNITTTLDTEKLKETLDEFAKAVREAAKEGGGTLSPEVTDVKL